MILTLCLKINLVRLFWGSVISKPFRLSIDGHTGSPFILEPNYAHEPRFISSIWLANILRVSGCTYISQVFKLIIGFIAVYVVNQSNRPCTSNIQPCKSMRFIDTGSYSDSHVSNSFLFAPCNISNMNSFTRSVKTMTTSEWIAAERIRQEKKWAAQHR